MDSLATPSPAGSEEVPDLIPARMLNALVYCPRLFHLEWVQREWEDSADTVAGTRDHRNVDRESGTLPEPGELGLEGFKARAVMLSAPDEGIVARMDLLEALDGEVVPVDYKHGRAPEDDLGIWDTDRIQLGAQALVLRANGYHCPRAVVWYGGSRRRTEIQIDDLLIEEVRGVARRARSLASSPTPPPPLVDSPRCPHCSLVGICLPDEQNHLLATASDPEEVRRLYPVRDDALPVYVQAQGARVGKDADELDIWERDHGKRRVRLIDTSQLALFGNVTVTAGALSALLGRGIPVCHFSYGGWFYGVTHPLGNRNCELRVHQYETARRPDASLALARGFVARKILNCRTLLRRNGQDVPAQALSELTRCAEEAARSDAIEHLLGVEGQAARTYFGAFPAMLKEGLGEGFDFQGRNRRPPKDPINALLSLAYSVLTKDWTVTLFAVGLDPFLGFYHRPRFGRPALALDLMEEFRPLVADSVVLQVLNNGEVQEKDFVGRGAGVALTEAGRRSFFLAYERRMNHLVTHPAFGYQVSYRRLLEVETRLLGRHLTGELPSYDGFRTR
ncbi:MAG: CRISPR-associated endonuclease Cas1 [Candidatus Thermoplasmatota archaeon]